MNECHEAAMVRTNDLRQQQEKAVFFGSCDALAAVAIAPVKKFPAIGDSLAILHQVKRASDGAVLGLQRNDKPVWTKVKQVYLDGSVKCADGDVWEVVAGQKAMWQTVNPYRGGEEK